MRNKIKTLEKQIDKLNHEKDEIEAKLADHSIYDDSNKQQLKTLLAQQTTVSQELDKTEEEWLAVSDEVEQLQQEA